MPALLWLALLFGYFVGVAGAMFLLPAPVVEPLTGRIVVASLVIVLGAATFLVLQRRGSRALLRARASAPERDGAFAQARAETAGAPDLKPRDERIDDIAGDLERLESLAQGSRSGARAPDGSLGPRELRQILYDGRMEILARPVLALPGRDSAFLLVTPRLLDREGRAVAASSYRRTLARCGLHPVFDRVQVIRALQTAEAARRDGDIPAVACVVAAQSLASPVLLDGLEDVLRDGIGRGARLILELDQLPRAPAVRQAARRLQRHGVRLALKRLSAAPLDLERMAELGVTFVHLAAPRFAVLPGAAAGALPSLDALLGSAERAALTVVVDQADSEPAPMLTGGPLAAPLPPVSGDEVRDDAA